MFPTPIPIVIPTQLNTDDKQLNKMALLILTPFFNSIAKSPTKLFIYLLFNLFII